MREMWRKRLGRAEAGAWRATADGGHFGLWVEWDVHPGEITIGVGIAMWMVSLWWWRK